MNMEESLKKQIRKIRQGDIRAFEDLFHAYYGRLCDYANTLVKSDEMAEEVVQELFYSLWKNRGTLVMINKIDSYLYRAARNNALMLLRKKKPDRLPDDADLRHAGPKEEDPSEILQTKELEEVIEKCIAGLPTQSKKIYGMSRDESMKYREIAEALNISEKTVEGHMNRALRSLKEAVDTYKKDKS